MAAISIEETKASSTSILEVKLIGISERLDGVSAEEKGKIG